MGHEVDRILDQLERAFRREAWHGPAVQEALEGIDNRAAAARPLQGAHTIWELTLHIAYWKEIVRSRLAGERPETDESLNFPDVKDTSAAAWQRVQADLEATHQALQAEIQRLNDEDLDTPAPGGTLSRYVMVHGVVQHDLYHAGQIAILKKPQKPAKKPAVKTPAKKKPPVKKPARKPARAASRSKARSANAKRRR